MAKHTIQGDFGFDTAPAKASLNDIEKHVKSLGPRLEGYIREGGVGKGFKENLGEAGKHVEGFGAKIEGLFKRDTARRAAIAFEDLARDLVSGNTAEAVTGFARRIGGIGLAASIGAGVVIGVFEKVTQQIQASGQATRDLEAELSKPIGSQAQLGIEGINQELQKTGTLLTNFVAAKSTFFGKVGESFREGGVGSAALTFLTGGRTGPQKETAGELSKGFGRENELRQAGAETETEILKNREKQLGVSQEAAAIDKISIQTSEKKAAIENELADRRAAVTKQLKDDEEARAVGQTGLSKDVRKALQDELALYDDQNSTINKTAKQRIQTATESGDIETRAAKGTFDARSRQVGLEQTLADLAHGLASTATISLESAKGNLKVIQDEISERKKLGTLSKEEEQALRVKETQAKTALEDIQVGRIARPGEVQNQEIQAAANREFRKAVQPEGFTPRYPGDSPHRDTSGNIISSPAYRTSPQAYGQTGGPSEPYGHTYQSELGTLRGTAMTPLTPEQKAAMEKPLPQLEYSGQPASPEFQQTQDIFDKTFAPENMPGPPSGLGLGEVGGNKPQDFWSNLGKSFGEISPDVGGGDMTDVIKDFTSKPDKPVESFGADQLGAGDFPKMTAPPELPPQPQPQAAAPQAGGSQDIGAKIDQLITLTRQAWA